MNTNTCTTKYARRKAQNAWVKNILSAKCMKYINSFKINLYKGTEFLPLTLFFKPSYISATGFNKL